jgi:hypothetical protein
MRYPGATWRGPVPGYAPGGMAGHRLFVLHVQQGSESGTDAWFHNPAAQVSSHFGNPKTGSVDQWVDTDDRAWAEAAYNNVAISVENEGNTGDGLTASQIENAAHLLAWAHQVHGTPLQVTDDSNGAGVIGHGLLGVAGGDHPDCPGAPILAQRQAVVDRAKQILGQTPVPASAGDARVRLLQQLLNQRGAALAEDGIKGPLTKGAFARALAGLLLVKGSAGLSVKILQAMLNTWGYGLAVDGQDGDLTTGAVEDFQSRHNCTRDGEVGPQTQAALAR